MMRTRTIGLGLTLILGAAGCNSHPLVPFEQSVSATQHQELTLNGRGAIDLLFVIDDSGSMCQEQTSLARNFTVLADFFNLRLGPAADLRVAVTSTSRMADGGQFLARPAQPIPDSSCTDADTGEPWVPETADCADLELDPVLMTGPDGNVGRDCAESDPDAQAACVRADLERRFRCMASLGVGGANQEQGLEAMRLALSCDGPNAAHFGPCCASGGFDPTCGATAESPLAPSQAPDFLRPEALLVVVIVADEDDCSDPAANPIHSTRPLCRHGLADADRDGLPDAFGDPTLCAGLSPAACFQRDCEGLDAEACWQARCEVQNTEFSSCVWQREALTPVEDYVRFLHSRKAQPGQQVLVASVVGGRVFTPGGEQVSFHPGDPRTMGPGCEFNDLSLAITDECCPDGDCLGEPIAACNTTAGEAYTGERYLQLAETIGALGIDCVTPETSLCAGDLAAPLQSLTGCLDAALSFFCLDKPVADHTAIQVAIECTEPTPGTLCAQQTGTLRLPTSSWRAGVDERCAAGTAVYLLEAPPAGATLSVDYPVAI